MRQRRIKKMADHIRKAWGICKQQAVEEATRIVNSHDRALRHILKHGGYRVTK